MHLYSVYTGYEAPMRALCIHTESMDTLKYSPCALLTFTTDAFSCHPPYLELGCFSLLNCPPILSIFTSTMSRPMLRPLLSLLSFSFLFCYMPGKSFRLGSGLPWQPLLEESVSLVIQFIWYGKFSNWVYCYIVEVIGLAARAWSHSNPSAKEALYIIQTILILFAPIIFSAVVYMFLGRLIRASGHPRLSFIRINVVTKLFVCGDILCFFIQAGGAGKLVHAETPDEISTAQNTVLVGLILQIVFFCIFVSCAIVSHVRVSNATLRGRWTQNCDYRRCLSPSVFAAFLSLSEMFIVLLSTEPEKVDIFNRMNGLHMPSM